MIFFIIFFVARFQRDLILRVNVKKKNGEKKVEEIIVRNLLNTILFINEHGSIRSKSLMAMFILCLKINRSLSILNV